VCVSELYRYTQVFDITAFSGNQLQSFTNSHQHTENVV